MFGSRLLLPFVGISFFLLTPSAAAAPRTVVATVERVSDGDTLIAITENQTKLRIRLLGIDAPEIPHGKKMGQAYGLEARDGVRPLPTELKRRVGEAR